jgi:hypothetical protein
MIYGDTVRVVAMVGYIYGYDYYYDYYYFSYLAITSAISVIYLLTLIHTHTSIYHMYKYILCEDI